MNIEGGIQIDQQPTNSSCSVNWGHPQCKWCLPHQPQPSSHRVTSTPAMAEQPHSRASQSTLTQSSPLHGFLQPLPLDGRSLEDGPRPVFQSSKAQGIGDFRRTHGPLNILGEKDQNTYYSMIFSVPSISQSNKVQWNLQ